MLLVRRHVTREPQSNPYGASVVSAETEGLRTPYRGAAPLPRKRLHPNSPALSRRQQSRLFSPLATEALSCVGVEGKAIVGGSLSVGTAEVKSVVYPEWKYRTPPQSPRPSVCWSSDLRRSSLVREIAANGEMGEESPRRPGSGLSHGRALTDSLLTRHHPTPHPHAPLLSISPRWFLHDFVEL